VAINGTSKMVLKPAYFTGQLGGLTEFLTQNLAVLALALTDCIVWLRLEYFM
jgi:hypothetical protein